MKIEEISKQVKAAERIEMKYLIIGMIPIILYIIYKSTPLSSMFSIPNCESISSTRIDLIIRGAALVFLFILVGFGRRLEKKAYPICPHCKELINKLNVGIVIATKNCTSCGKSIAENNDRK